jgi:hypothetical protein
VHNYIQIIGHDTIDEIWDWLDEYLLDDVNTQQMMDSSLARPRVTK